MSLQAENVFIRIAVLTVSDTRDETTDTSGRFLVERLQEAGHHLAEKTIIPDNVSQIRAIISRWIADPTIHVIISTGGTGLTGRDSTPEAVLPLLDKSIDGFGEVFRSLSYQEIKTSTIQSRAVAGVANGTILFCLPGSTGACRTAWNHIIHAQLDHRHRPCNLIEILPRMQER